MSETREQIIEQMAQAVATRKPDGQPLVAAALPIAVKAVTDRVRELHVRASEPFAATSASADVVWRYFCDQCGPLGSWPCPTVHLLDRIDAELGGQ